MSSIPVTETSSGTLRPAARKADIAPIAMASLPASTACLPSIPASASSRAAANPPSLSARQGTSSMSLSRTPSARRPATNPAARSLMFRRSPAPTKIATRRCPARPTKAPIARAAPALSKTIVSNVRSVSPTTATRPPSRSYASSSFTSRSSAAAASSRLEVSTRARGRSDLSTRTVSDWRSGSPIVDDTVTNAPSVRASRSIAATTRPMLGVVRSSATSAIESLARRIALAEASTV